MASKLKPCPFCGEAQRLRVESGEDGDYAVQCKGCFANGPQVFASRYYVRKLWNTRVRPRQARRRARKGEVT